ncbi:unnamed protein product [Didymodactylos carnosus]|uniref:Methyltransferase domain-containing protein n=1 Tax=Didymodactylos carnosus TaxID=1234261 RepID=A0A814G9V4_9BILA|nr:unnamed protein product [Didymodactylos carnosus]CAF1421077.1 unnamed protein product [Didymodactylos carnosus]CAF3763316.1 unnamed protein product [Didymodactylos carnosus]CAF4221759.1 unnamed protein product [Didymodactylos carnosus]
MRNYYMGRLIGQVMPSSDAALLSRSQRAFQERPDLMLNVLNIRPGMIVADVGAGTGYTSLQIAKRVGPTGIVFSTDVQKSMLQLLTINAIYYGMHNIRPVLSTADNPNLPHNSFDLILMVDTYHECSNPPATLRGLRKALKPNGRIVVVEYRAEDANIPLLLDHKMSIYQTRLEFETNGFIFIGNVEILPLQHIMIFQKQQVRKQVREPVSEPVREQLREPVSEPVRAQLREPVREQLREQLREQEREQV